MARRGQHSTGVGGFIRQHVIPAGMSVTEAARKLGVGRPALSNLLNGRAALSPSMALRLEATFGADRTKLLDLQAAADRDRRSVEDRAVAVGTYAPSFLTIKARQIEEWAPGSDRELPVLLRRLVHATGRELRHVDFPGYDNAQRGGWDGWVEADAGTPWVPEGKSGWEFSVHHRPSSKAEQDYQARLKSVPRKEREECTFVFVTPRNWKRKEEWARRKEADGEWKAVRARDASDLEQWLETTISPRIWLAGELGVPTDGFETPDCFWDRWAAASEPRLSAAIFAPSVAAHVKEFTKWLEKAQPDLPFSVAADSREEAVAFVACLLQHEEIADRDRNRAVVFQSASPLRTLGPSTSPFMPIVYSEETEREIAALYRQRHCVVIRPRNAVDQKPDVAVELLGHDGFEKALADMGIEDRDHVDRLASESGRSPTVLRRRLSKIPAIKTPPWAADEKIARTLIPMALVGAWHKGSQADRKVLKKLAGAGYDQLEQRIAALLHQDDCPVWCVGQYRGVVSKVDALFAISRWMTEKDVSDFLRLAKYVLSESDPADELPEDQRWAAGLYGKVREHSGALRAGIRETLVLLSVHGQDLFRGLTPDAEVAALVKRLLTPFTSDKLRSHDGDLPDYAEAAPDAFLTLLETDLRKEKPALLALLKPVQDGFFGSPARTGVLWALERLAWNPRTLMRVVNILARLSRTKIDDNWGNKPINSLAAIFLSWYPQTSTPLDGRIKALEALCRCRCFRDIGWQICIQQFEAGTQIGHDSARPRWRRDAAEAGRGVSDRERYEFVGKAFQMAIHWRAHDANTLGDLIERLHSMSDDHRSLLWDRIDAWSKNTKTDGKARATLRERIRFTVLTRWGLYHGLPARDRNRARELFDDLASGNPVRDHAWLFAHASVEAMGDGLEEESENDALDDWKKQNRHIHDLRTEAMNEICSTHGSDGVRKLLTDGDAGTVGWYAARSVSERCAVTGVLHDYLFDDINTKRKIDDFMRGYIAALDKSIRSTLIAELVDKVTVEQRVRVFLCCPFHDETWRLLDRQDQGIREQYWIAVRPPQWRLAESAMAEAIDRLVEAGRPRAAFRIVHSQWDKIETSRMKRLLSTIEVDEEPSGEYEIDPYELSRALKSLDGRPGVTVNELAQLEFAFITALDRSKHGIPNIERKLSESPRLFVRMLILCYRRNDGKEDPPEWHNDDQERNYALAVKARTLLDLAKRAPGTDNEGKVNAEALKRWMIETRHLCKEYGRAEIGDERIGDLLSKAPEGEDGFWPCRPVCEVMEEVASEEVANGFSVGAFNARGVYSRSLDEGGVQERELSAKYRRWFERAKFDYPYVAKILERIANRYDRDAEREDSEVLARRRLEH